jgi:hypothetical protein
LLCFRTYHPITDLASHFGAKKHRSIFPPQHTRDSFTPSSHTPLKHSYIHSMQNTGTHLGRASRAGRQASFCTSAGQVRSSRCLPGTQSFAELARQSRECQPRSETLECYHATPHDLQRRLFGFLLSYRAGPAGFCWLYPAMAALKHLKVSVEAIFCMMLTCLS